MRNHPAIFAAPSPEDIETALHNMANQNNEWKTMLYCGLPKFKFENEI